MHTTQIAFRKATTADLEEAWTLLDTARNLMLTNGRKQWTKDYPSRELIENDIAGGDAYILTVNGEVAAYAKLAVNGEPEYAHLEGSWLSEQDYVVIHRLAVSPQSPRTWTVQTLLPRGREMGCLARRSQHQGRYQL
ncbi:MAG: GNAT family N-acetyltransferase [Hoylesella buccalis]